MAGATKKESWHFIANSLFHGSIQFEKIVGIPNDMEYDNPESGPNRVYEIMFEDVAIEALQLWIRQDYFEKNMKGKRLEVYYLPYSHYAMDIHVVDK